MIYYLFIFPFYAIKIMMAMGLAKTAVSLPRICQEFDQTKADGSYYSDLLRKSRGFGF